MDFVRLCLFHFVKVRNRVVECEDHFLKEVPIGEVEEGTQRAINGLRDDTSL